MKGVILAGGRGTRLGRHTIVLNKHLVAVGQYPMIEYPLATLLRIGIKDIIVVVGAEHAGLIMNYLANAHPHVDFTYKVQREAGGIAQALGLVENVASGESLAVILGDNIFNEDFSEHARRFEEEKLGAMLFL
ncbi:spore coat protein, partial [Candidatus Woesearchaeota archaeon]